MPSAMQPAAAHADVDTGPSRGEARRKWGWFVALGVLMVILSAVAFANLLVATLATVAYIGVMMMLGAIAHIFEAFQVRRWGPFFMWLLAGLLYGAAAVLIFYNPGFAASALTIAVAVALVFSGVMRIGAGVRARPDAGWGWIIASGVITLLVGIIVAVGWPANTLWLLGLFLAIDLTFQGAAAIAFGVALKAAR